MANNKCTYFENGIYFCTQWFHLVVLIMLSKRIEAIPDSEIDFFPSLSNYLYIIRMVCNKLSSNWLRNELSVYWKSRVCMYAFRMYAYANVAKTNSTILLLFFLLIRYIHRKYSIDGNLFIESQYFILTIFFGRIPCDASCLFSSSFS